MGTEIERKFIVVGEGWRAGATGVRYRQGYLSTETGATVRVRLAGDEAFLTIKGARVGLGRPEFEYPLPRADAEYMLDQLCRKPLIEKDRYRVQHGGLVWEVDEFLAENEGLLVAEVELESEDQPVALPEWVGPEVSTDVRYTNAYLVSHPYNTWRD
ncbi:MAG: CYTH domain-containing protein [Anaerolineales bacterium]